MNYYVEVEDWDTATATNIHNFRARSGWVEPGPSTPLVTMFGTLTYAQVVVLAQENDHYRRLEANRRAP